MTKWTIETLKEYFDKRFETAEESVKSALSAAKEAVTKAETAAEKRFECVSSDTPILCADLVWRPAGELKVGDELIGLDEHSPSRPGRRFRRSVVTANSLAEDKLFTVNTPLGSVRCNANHPWLVRDHEWKWVKTSDIKVGDEVSRPVDVWETDTSWESGWLAGMFDGEGCLSIGTSVGKLRVQLSLSQRESLTSDRIAKELLKRLGREALSYRYEPGTSTTPKNKVPFFHFLVVRKADIMKIIGSTRSPRLLAKASGVWEDKVIAGNDMWSVVTSIEDFGKGTIARLSTSTHTYLAGGFAMHNSVNEFRNTLSDQQRNLMPRSEAEVKFEGYAKQLEMILSRLDKTEGKGLGIMQLLGWIIAGITIIGFIVSNALKVGQ